ncbi:MAG: DNA primase [Bacteroidetes bacterium]|nr:DNA primase [Bacteroidota bacterium]
MTIQEIKERLHLNEVLNYYGLSPNKNKMLNCPFHEDKTPSMQIYEETNTAYCFSSNCQLHGKSIDQIDFIMHKESLTKHESIEKAKQIAGIIETPKQKKEDLEEIFQVLRKNLIRSSKAQKYLKERNLSEINEIGYNYRTVKELRDCIVFPLKNKENKTVSFYGRNINNNRNGRHYYTTNRRGLYPNYPSSNVKTLILTESIIDAVSIKQNTNYELLALYGTNGLTKEHIQAISSLKNLKEIIFFLDGDESGKSAVDKYSKSLNQILPEIIISKVNIPEGEDPNSLIQSHEKEILNHLIKERKIIYQSEETEKSKNLCLQRNKKLDTRDGNYIKYIDKNVELVILGGINLYPLDRLKVTLKINKSDSYNPLHRIRDNLDLYSSAQTEKLIKQISERLDISTKELQIIITELTEELENYREEQINKQKPEKIKKRELSFKRKEKAINWLKKTNLLQRTNELIGQSGVVGEEINRLLMYLIFTSRLREQPLHIISLGSSGTGKTYLQEKISQLIPEEHKLEITTLSENALYYFDQTELKNKLVLIEDLDGAQDEKILYALRELMSKKQITKTIPIKDAKGNLKTITLQVEGPISLAGTTTREKLYEDNANRSILIYLDNNKKHKESIMDYQRKLSSGKINKSKEEEIKEFIKDIQTVLKNIKVINPYAEQLKIPETDFKPLRTNAHYLNFIEVITFYKQYQRKIKLDENGEKYIETTLEDIKEANSLLKEVLLSKSDELTKASRNFLEMIKAYLANHQKETFYSKELRIEYRINPNTLKRYLRELRLYGYLKIIGGTSSKGYEYELEGIESYDKLKKEITNALERALKVISVGQWVSSGSVAKMTH